MVAAIKGIRSSALGSARMEGGGGGSSRGWKERGGGMRCRAAAGCARGRGAAAGGEATARRGWDDCGRTREAGAAEPARQNVRHAVVGRLHCIHN
jgi:hypothetical protein